MKHAIKGLHGHMCTYSSKTGKFGKRCVTRSDIARSDYDSEEIWARERVSLKWKVCMWCFRPVGAGATVLDRGDKPLAYECGINKCPAWVKPVKVGKGVMVRQKKRGLG
jgi:hypothetical protein